MEHGRNSVGLGMGIGVLLGSGDVPFPAAATCRSLGRWPLRRCLSVHAMIPPGYGELLKMAVELAQSGALTPLNGNEREIIRATAMDSEPIFTKQA
jgi:hypothetical protein